MRFWLATGDPKQVEYAADLGIFTSIVTNPDAIAAANKPTRDVLRGLLRACTWPVYVMLREAAPDAMLTEASRLLDLDPARVGIKLALTPNGLRTARRLHDQGVRDLMATCIPVTSHVLLASAAAGGAGARWITPWGSWQQKTGGPARETVLSDMQASLEGAGVADRTQLIVGISSAIDLPKLAQMRIRHCFVWDKDVNGLIDSDPVRQTLATFSPAWEKLASLDRQQT
jgi:hypothetical protein